MPTSVPLRHGSPPRAWGALREQGQVTQSVRFTPTCVGSASSLGFATGRASVHPHVRGERQRRKYDHSMSSGSPPRAWGARTPRSAWSPAGRFTPTCVGSACASVGGSSRWSVHPHVRGERTNAASFSASSPGSPPRAWGAPAERRRGHQRHRFTPTCVGSASAISVSDSSTPVHPHVRGERRRADCSRLRSIGSPPRAWGAPQKHEHRRHSSRFTPTCVGSAPASRVTCWPTSVHPHVRGER